MKIECLKNKLQKAVSLVERATSHNLSLPALKNIIFKAEGSNLIIKATNLEIGVEINLPVKVIKDGIVACNPAILSSFLTNIKDEDKITAELENGNLIITTQSNSTLIKSEDYEDFPIIPKINSNKPTIIKSNELISGIRSVIYSAAISDIKPEISSVYIYSKEDKLYFVATDSFRLAEKNFLTNRKPDGLLPLIIPFKNAAEIVRVFENEDVEVEIHSDNNQLSLIGGSIHITSRLIDGVYPDYNQIMPKSFTTTTSILKEDLSQALKVSNIFSGKYHQIKIDLIPDKKQIVIYSEAADVGKNTTIIKANIEGPAFSANYNARYILEAFQSINFSEIMIGANESNKPMVVKGKGDSTFTYIVMPVNR
ncbi:MAG: DNA polymerase III subunit beta [Candidatus Vogelbacteria bacterium RIFOXYD1_FULL_44_32]|uniref:Beta sliding clamp n=1 Tax=Candidatus Vogelbacteria bacterium RIFOXYD1_FULL_44_32 TaxID=1802438 RepID=A0A1G2QE84_9BACT|nr:MAG: DNA polymerase III subunit beta [Candidatus Vogelbacteria bacterium RIFOXYD1_FULL_44_32]